MTKHTNQDETFEATPRVEIGIAIGSLQLSQLRPGRCSHGSQQRKRADKYLASAALDTAAVRDRFSSA